MSGVAFCIYFSFALFFRDGAVQYALVVREGVTKPQRFVASFARDRKLQVIGGLKVVYQTTPTRERLPRKAYLPCSQEAFFVFAATSTNPP